MISDRAIWAQESFDVAGTFASLRGGIGWVEVIDAAVEWSCVPQGPVPHDVGAAQASETGGSAV